MTNLSCLFMAASSYFANRQWPLKVTKHVKSARSELISNLQIFEVSTWYEQLRTKTAFGPDGVTVHASSLIWRLEKAVV